MPVLGISLGLQYGPLTQRYARRVEQAGGRFDPGGRALRALDTMLYGEYSNGSGGTASVASLATGFVSLWCPFCSFSGITISLIGPDVVNTNYVSGDYSLQSGLQGGSTKFLSSTIALNQMTGSIYGLGAYFNTALNLSTSQVMGARATGSTFCLDVGANGGTPAYRIRPGVSGATPTTVSGNSSTGMMFMSRLAASGADSVKLFQPDGTESTFNLTAAAAAGSAIYYGALNVVNASSDFILNIYNAAFVTRGLAFNTPEAAVLRAALNEANTARATL